MTSVLFTNVRILEGGGTMPYGGSVLVQDGRIRAVGRSLAAAAPAGATVIDGAGATLMPGMCEAHTHFSWNDAATLDAIQRMPLEEHVLWCAKVARRYLEAGFTSCVGAACAKPRLDVVIRNAINAGQIPGPRYLAASQEITVPGGLGDETLPHLPFPEFSFGVNVNSADEMRRAVRLFLKYGVDSIKLNLSGDNFTPQSPANTTWMSDAEVAAAMDEVRVRGKRGTAHARSAASVKQALRHGIDVIYHASYTDEETLDMLEAAKDRLRRARHRHPVRDAARGRALGHHARQGRGHGLPA
jgi:imidazolonepropionase-like amidohydrolase